MTLRPCARPGCRRHLRPDAKKQYRYCGKRCAGMVAAANGHFQAHHARSDRHHAAPAPVLAPSSFWVGSLPRSFTPPSTPGLRPCG